MSTPPSVRIGKWAVKFRSVNWAPKRGFGVGPAAGGRVEEGGVRAGDEDRVEAPATGPSDPAACQMYRPSCRTRASSPNRFMTGAMLFWPGRWSGRCSRSPSSRRSSGAALASSPKISVLEDTDLDERRRAPEAAHRWGAPPLGHDDFWGLAKVAPPGTGVDDRAGGSLPGLVGASILPLSGWGRGGFAPDTAARRREASSDPARACPSIAWLKPLRGKNRCFGLAKSRERPSVEAAGGILRLSSASSQTASFASCFKKAGIGLQAGRQGPQSRNYCYWLAGYGIGAGRARRTVTIRKVYRVILSARPSKSAVVFALPRTKNQSRSAPPERESTSKSWRAACKADSGTEAWVLHWPDRVSRAASVHARSPPKRMSLPALAMIASRPVPPTSTSSPLPPVRLSWPLPLCRMLPHGPAKAAGCLHGDDVVPVQTVDYDSAGDLVFEEVLIDARWGICTLNSVADSVTVMLSLPPDPLR